MTSRSQKRLSGHQHRKKAKVRKTTDPSVFEFLRFATRGVWPLQGAPHLRADRPGAGRGVFSPTLFAVRNLALDYLQQIEPQRHKPGSTDIPFDENAFRDFLNAYLKERQERGGGSDAVVQQILHVQGLCIRALIHLDEEERWRNVYRCASCAKWFFARTYDPRNPLRPYCSSRCWPSSNVPDGVSPPRRVQSRKN